MRATRLVKLVLQPLCLLMIFMHIGGNIQFAVMNGVCLYVCVRACISVYMCRPVFM